MEVVRSSDVLTSWACGTMCPEFCGLAADVCSSATFIIGRDGKSAGVGAEVAADGVC